MRWRICLDQGIFFPRKDSSWSNCRSKSLALPTWWLLMMADPSSPSFFSSSFVQQQYITHTCAGVLKICTCVNIPTCSELFLLIFCLIFIGSWDGPSSHSSVLFVIYLFYFYFSMNWLLDNLITLYFYFFLLLLFSCIASFFSSY